MELLEKSSEYNTSKRRYRSGGVELDRKDIVDRANYRTLEQQVSVLTAAGRQLSEYRRYLYEFGISDDIPDDYVDVTKVTGFDAADASNLHQRSQERLKAAYDNMRAKQAQGGADESAGQGQADAGGSGDAGAPETVG